MVTELTRQKTEKTKSLAEATKQFFGLDLEGRLCIFTQEAMKGQIAKAYNKLGLESRNGTYQKICEDFKKTTGCYSSNHPSEKIGTIIDIGSGSGLLSLQLAERTEGQIIGIDLSADMIQLANQNLKTRCKEKTKEIKNFWKRLPKGHGPTKEDFKKLKENPPFYDSLEFRKGSVYDLPSLVSDRQDINYIICRNALHRFRKPKEALQKMLKVSNPQGKLYIRDLKRDANWKTVVKRVGDKRWENLELVRDYLGAMAQMLTTRELTTIMEELGVKNFKILDGSYRDKKTLPNEKNINEYAQETEYVCIVEKS